MVQASFWLGDPYLLRRSLIDPSSVLRKDAGVRWQWRWCVLGEQVNRSRVLVRMVMLVDCLLFAIAVAYTLV